MSQIEVFMPSEHDFGHPFFLLPMQFAYDVRGRASQHAPSLLPMQSVCAVRR
jgi:hypothetical protein